MKNGIIVTCIVFCMANLSLVAQTPSKPAGSGTKEAPYQISSLENLFWLSQTTSAWDSYLIQTADIDASETEGWDNGHGFIPLGNATLKFSGSYNGKGYQISNLYMNYPDEFNVGLFGYTNGAILDSINLTNSSVTGARIVGGLVGYLQNGSITNCTSNGIVSGDYYIGGLIGLSNATSINTCYTTGKVSGERYTGGLIGITQSSNVSNSYSSCAIFGAYNVGGFVGQNSYASNIINCYTTGNVTGSSVLGGFAGINIFSASIQNCYSIGKVSGDEVFGGFVGNNLATLTNCYYNIEISGQSEGMGSDSKNQTVTGLTIDQMKNEASFGGFDFVLSWSINQGISFPALQLVYDLPIVLDDITTTSQIDEIYKDTLHIIPMESGIGSITLIDNPEGLELINDSIIEWTPGGVGISPFSIKLIDTNGVETVWTNKIVVISYEGAGTPESPYQITDIDGLNLVREYLDKHFILMNDLDFSGSAFDSDASSNGWLPIGSEVAYFKGSFNGGGHSISNLFINRPEEDYVGLFGFTKDASIDSLALVNGSVTGNQYVGGIAGYIKETGITICYSSCSVSGESFTGGFTGYFFNGTIQNCYVAANVSGSYKIGGLVGYNQNGKINNCYATGRISCQRESGALVGYNNDDITNSYYNIETSGQDSGIGEDANNKGNVTGLTTAQMKNASSFGGFDLATVWEIDEGQNFPCLRGLNDAPLVLQDISVYGQLNELFTDTLHVISMDNDVVSISLVSYPDGMELVNGSIIKWTPSATGVFYFAIKATDSKGVYTTTYFKVIVTSLGGEGTDSSPYQVTNIDELSQIQYFPDKYFVLMNNLDFADTEYDSINSNVGWPPVCNYAYPFTGNFNGSGYVINNLYINRAEEDYSALFGMVEGGTIENLGVTNGFVKGNYSIGGIVGYIDTGMVSNCYFTGSVSGKESVGGIVGEIYKGAISNCYSTAKVQGEEMVGGLVGALYKGAISNCYASGSAKAYSYVAGLAGYNDEGTVNKCYATGKVSGTEYFGGLIGYNGMAELSNVYFNIETTGQNTGIGFDENSQGVTGLTTAEMKLDTNFHGFSFDSVWSIRKDSTYPALKSLNNAPFAFADTITGSLQAVLNNDFDYETLQEYLVCKFNSVVIKQTGEKYIPGNMTLSTGDTLLVSYQVGEYSSSLIDTLWGNSVTSVLLYKNHAPKISSIAPTTATVGVEYSYTVSASDEDGDALVYSLLNAPEGMIITDSIITWTPSVNTATSGEVTLLVSDLDLIAKETFTIMVMVSGIDENLSESISLYPNPVKDAFQIKGINSGAKLYIYNSLGALLLVKDMAIGETTIEVGNLPYGTYVVKIKYSDKSVTKSFLKMK